MDHVSKKVRSKIMATVRSKGNRTTELALGRLLWAAGLRGYRADLRSPGGNLQSQVALLPLRGGCRESAIAGDGTPVEVVESLAPLLIERKALRDGSGGDGRHRGGLGQVIAFRVRSDEPATCSFQARSLMAQYASPGGIISAFCEPPMMTSMP